MADLKVDHLYVIGAGEFDTSYAPVEFDDGKYHIKCVVNYGSYDRIKQYREGGILWSIIDTETNAEIRLVAQEGDARFILFAEDKEAGEEASTEFSLAESVRSHEAKSALFNQLGSELEKVADIDIWMPLLEVAFRDIDMDATLRGLGYTPADPEDGEE